MRLLLKNLHQLVKLHSRNQLLLSRRNTSAWTLHRLRSRGLLKLTGSDAVPFLQGLITNDVTALHGCPSLYAMLLNVQGRVMYDLIMYNTDENGILLEHDRSVTSDLTKILKQYKIRRKVDLSDVSEESHVFAALPPSGTISAESNMLINQKILSNVCEDPRLNSFGKRIIAQDEDKIIQSVSSDANLLPSSEESYHETRYKLGISEGVLDIPPGNCFPLESNAVYLNGVCFHKGCYIGQELTARTFHTGVTRKRLMPLQFECVPKGLTQGDNIVNQNGKPVGKFRNSAGKYGLGLLRMAQIKGPLTITNTDGQIYNVIAEAPSWWPKDEEKGYL